MLLAPFLLAGAPAAHAACDSVTHTQVMAAARSAPEAFVGAEPDRILAAATSVRAALPCVQTRLLPEEVGAVHRLFAYEAYVRRNPELATRWLEASRAADPDHVLAEGALPDRHPLVQAYQRAEATPFETEPLSLRRGEVAWVDGREAEAVPVGRPSLVQIVTAISVVTELRPEGGAPSRTMHARPVAVDGEPSRRGVRMAFGLTGLTANHDEGPWGYGGPELRIHVPLTEVVHFEVMGAFALTQGVGEAAIVGLPLGQLGLAARAQDDGGVIPWASAGLLVLSDMGGAMPGAGASAGVDVPVGKLWLAPEVRGGWVTGSVLGDMTLFGLGIGAGVTL